METVVRTRNGAVRGEIVGGIAVFRGIPYAAPPFGSHRFRPPQPVEAWDGVRDALVFGPTAPKPPYAPPLDVLLAEPVVPGEDCLNLNIWTPDPGAVHLPVMVWIHGGAFINGTGMVPTYDGSHFARDGVVCVTINYRLGIEGFLYLGKGTANLGLLDQVAALQWVQENITAFGGDPARVTIFGQSAGSMSVNALLSMPRAAGLFRRAIIQSGSGYHALSLETAQLMGQHIAEKLGVAATPAAFAAQPADRLIAAQAELVNEASTQPDPQRWREVLVNLMPFEPVIDGEVLPDLPITRLAAGAGAGVEVMAGTTTDEFRLFLVPAGAIGFLGEEELIGLSLGYGIPLADMLDTYRALHPNATPGDLFVSIVTDWFFRIPALRLVEARTAHAEPAYLYEFAWRSPQFNGCLGACHIMDIAFVFDNLQQPENEGLLGSAPPQSLADTMHAAWVAFATTGHPGWPRYDLSRRATMRFDTNSVVVEDPYAVERTFWEGKR